MIDKKLVYGVYKNMRQYIGEAGYVSQVTRESRAAANESLRQLGMTPEAHSAAMAIIKEMRQGKAKDEFEADMEKLNEEGS